jgi:H+-translocating NAD(P) transhydrogenase subunit alpha
MVIGILKERVPEQRVLLTPETARELILLKAKIILESGAGANAFISDEAYLSCGVTVTSRKKVLSDADCMLTISGLSPEEYNSLRSGTTLVGFIEPYNNISLVEQLNNRKINAFSLDILPRTTLAQAMDVRSSMATVGGYKAVLDAAMQLPRFFPMFMTASGTIKPARVLILGAGVAGLQALATARRLGAVVEVFDVRAAVKEEVHSLGGKFIEVEGAQDDLRKGGYAVEQSGEFQKRQVQMIADHAIKADAVICTAQIPGKKAPLLLYEKTVQSMRPGSVIIDLAAGSGGNCELTIANETKVHHQITIIGKTEYPSLMSIDASTMISNNILNFLKLLLDPEGSLTLNWDNQIVKTTCVTFDGTIMYGKPNKALTQN